ncbi:MAG: glucosyl transferase [Proteobacteria bacterium]|nr:glucosyl transferase [Pseudomonadota bacterium]
MKPSDKHMGMKTGMIDRTASTRSSYGSENDGGQRRPLKIAFFGHDSNESTIRKRVSAFRAAGSNVIGFMFSRVREGLSRPVEWTNIDLGRTEDGYYGRRLTRLWQAIVVLRRHRDLLRTADVIYARNIDMLIVARIAKAMAGSDAPLVYEALDVHPAMTKRTGIGPILRSVERHLLKACSLLVVSSPTFIDRYFVPVQGYRGPWFLLENKVFADDGWQPESPAREEKSAVSPIWTIGWFGVIRCQRSLDILQRIAAALPDRIVVHLRGIPSEPDRITKEKLERLSSTTRNIFYFGPYRNPQDLPQMYGAVDLTWAVDFSAAGANSDWLIPNRLYEGGLYGVPAIARRSTATGKVVEEDGRGWCLDEPFETNLAHFLRTLDGASYTEMRATLCKKDRSAFVDVSDTADLVSKLSALALRQRAPE